MNETTQQILDDEQSSTPRIRRRDLLPIWIKVFTWIFLIGGGFAIASIPFALFGMHYELALYHFNTTDPLSLTGIFLLLVYALKGTVAYGLWWEKDWGVKLAIVDGVVGIVACVSYFIYSFTLPETRITIPIEILLLVPYLKKMYRVKEAWGVGEVRKG